MQILYYLLQAGYREGITAGKEEALQEGFDAGFAEFGAPVGKEIGVLRGMSAALLVFLDKYPPPPMPLSTSPPSNSNSTPEDDEAPPVPADHDKGNASDSDVEKLKAEVRNLVKELASLKLAGLLPPDIEAMDHAKEHAAQAAVGQEESSEGGAEEAKEGTEVFSDDINVEKATAKWKEARASLEGLKERLRVVLKAVGFGEIEM